MPPTLSASQPVFATDLNLPGRRQGKVRDTYELPGQPPRSRLLIIATDRISAFDVVMPTPVPGKGRLLTEISTFWFRFIEKRGLAKTHLISTSEGDIPASALRGVSREQLAGRVTIGARCNVIPIECVVRGYLEGSGWKDYQASGAVSGVKLPAGLKQCDRLPQPIFTPATKAPQGQHDENISFEEAGARVGKELISTLRDRTVATYSAAADYARSRGIIIADTKFEFGVVDGKIVLADEVLTPDSSRFWPADQYQPGHAQPSYDKQYVRDYLESIHWNKQPPAPGLPEEVALRTGEKYREAYTALTGGTLAARKSETS